MGFKPIAGDDFRAEDWFEEEAKGGGERWSKTLVKELNVEQGGDKIVIFVSNAPVVVKRHNFFKDTGKSQRYVCMAEHGGAFCPACAMDNWAAPQVFFHVIDCGVPAFNGDRLVGLTGFTPDDGKNAGKEYNFFKRLAVWNKGTKSNPGPLKTLITQSERKSSGRLAYTVWLVSRSGDKAPRSGTGFEFRSNLGNRENAIKQVMAWSGKPLEEVSPLFDPIDWASGGVLPEMKEDEMARIVGYRGGRQSSTRPAAARSAFQGDSDISSASFVDIDPEPLPDRPELLGPEPGMVRTGFNTSPAPEIVDINDDDIPF